jgi:hypothetical protein
MEKLRVFCALGPELLNIIHMNFIITKQVCSNRIASEGSNLRFDIVFPD